MSLFCRHNRFMAECPICSKGTVLDPNRSGTRRPSAPRPRSGGKKRPSGPPPGAARLTAGPYVSAGPYEREDGERYEVRLERVPGGVRLGSWSGSALERRAPVLAAADVAGLVHELGERELLPEQDREKLTAALGESGGGPGGVGTSAGRSGELREELRVERLEEGLVRVGRWIYRPGPAEWELQEAAPMLPAARFAEALAGAVRHGVLDAT